MVKEIHLFKAALFCLTKSNISMQPLFNPQQHWQGQGIGAKSHLLKIPFLLAGWVLVNTNQYWNYYTISQTPPQGLGFIPLYMKVTQCSFPNHTAEYGRMFFCFQEPTEEFIGIRNCYEKHTNSTMIEKFQECNFCTNAKKMTQSTFLRNGHQKCQLVQDQRQSHSTN